MPAKTDVYRIKDPFLDKRIKLLPCQRQMVIWWYSAGESIGAIAIRFKVNKRLVQFILFPERLEENKQRRLERGGWEQYYDKSVHSVSTKRHRDYKKHILNKIS